MLKSKICKVNYGLINAGIYFTSTIIYFIPCSSSLNVEEEIEENDSESDYDLGLDSYQSVRPIYSEHEVMIVTPKMARLSHHHLQCMHHGSTIIHLDDDRSRSYMCYLKLESDNATLSWHKPSWSSLMSSSISDYSLKGETDSLSTQVLCMRYSSGEDINDLPEEGYIDLKLVKDVFTGQDEQIDLSAISKRYGMDQIDPGHNMICVLYGTGHSENRKLYFVAPHKVARIWLIGLQKLVRAFHKLQWQTDKRVQHLKTQYLQLFYENERCQGPTPAEAIKVGV